MSIVIGLIILAIITTGTALAFSLVTFAIFFLLELIGRLVFRAKPSDSNK